jgi:ketosteroid isomerase-like protein
VSQENVDVVRRFHAAYDAADFEAMVDLCTADVRVSPDAAIFPEADSSVGREPLKSFVIGTTVAWAQVRYPISEATAVGDDRVLIRGEWGGTGVASGVEMVSSLSAVYTLQQGRIAKAEYFFDHAKALDAVGLER